MATGGSSTCDQVNGTNEEKVVLDEDVGGLERDVAKLNIGEPSDKYEPRASCDTKTDTSGHYVLVCRYARFSVDRTEFEKHSGYARSMESFYGHMDEMPEGQKDDHITEIDLNNFDCDAVVIVVEFVCGDPGAGKKTNIDLQNVMNVMNVMLAADFLDMPALLDECGNRLTSLVTLSLVNPKNYNDLLDMAAQLENHPQFIRALNHILNFISLNILRLSREKRSSLPQNLFISIIGNDFLGVGGLSLANLIKEWLADNKGINWDTPLDTIDPEDDVWKTLAEMMSHVQWASMDPDDIESLSPNVKHAMNQIPRCKEMLEQAKYYKYIWTMKHDTFEIPLLVPNDPDNIKFYKMEPGKLACLTAFTGIQGKQYFGLTKRAIDLFNAGRAPPFRNFSHFFNSNWISSITPHNCVELLHRTFPD